MQREFWVMCCLLYLKSPGSTATALPSKSRKSRFQDHVPPQSGVPCLISGFLVPALVSGYSELLNGSKELDLILNGLVSSVSGINPSAGAEALIQDGLPKLASLNVLSEVDDSFWNRVKEFRVIMLLRTTLNWVDALRDSSAHWLVSTEVLRLVRSLLPWIKHAEGDFWQKIYTLLFDSLVVESFLFLPLIVRLVCKNHQSFYL
jgi:hypothetical protein